MLTHASKRAKPAGESKKPRKPRKVVRPDDLGRRDALLGARTPPTLDRLVRETRMLARGINRIFVALHPLDRTVSRRDLNALLAGMRDHWDPEIVTVDGGAQASGDTRHVLADVFFAPTSLGPNLTPITADDRFRLTTGTVDVYLANDRLESITFEGAPWNARATPGMPRAIVDEYMAGVSAVVDGPRARANTGRTDARGRTLFVRNGGRKRKPGTAKA